MLYSLKTPTFHQHPIDKEAHCSNSSIELTFCHGYNELLCLIATTTTMESCIIGTKCLIATPLCHHLEYWRWHHTITLSHENPNSLAHPIGLLLSELKVLLTTLGLATISKNKQQLWIQAKVWNTLLINVGVVDNCYFDVMGVKYVGEVRELEWSLLKTKLGTRHQERGRGEW